MIDIETLALSAAQRSGLAHAAAQYNAALDPDGSPSPEPVSEAEYLTTLVRQWTDSWHQQKIEADAAERRLIERYKGLSEEDREAVATEILTRSSSRAT
jgi:hypothetical protein